MGLSAGVGPDMPPECTAWLSVNGIDTAGLAFVVRNRAGAGAGAGTDGGGWEGGGVDGSDFISASATSTVVSSPSRYRETPRAWQITEHDGRRTQVWRTPACPALYAMLRPPAGVLPPSYANAKAFHIGVHPERPDLTLLNALKASNSEALISVEPFTHAQSPPTPERLRQLCTAGDIFSPNELEAISLVGAGTPLELITRLAAAGAAVVCLRRGEEGAIVHDAATGETWSVPALLGRGLSLEKEVEEVAQEESEKGKESRSSHSTMKPAFLDIEGEVVDVTGCGNAFCGGFLASRLAGEGLLDAAVWGSVAASLMAEAVGVPEHSAGAGGDACRREAARRAEALRTRGRKLT